MAHDLQGHPGREAARQFPTFRRLAVCEQVRELIAKLRQRLAISPHPRRGRVSRVPVCEGAQVLKVCRSREFRKASVTLQFNRAGRGSTSAGTWTAEKRKKSTRGSARERQ